MTQDSLFNGKLAVCQDDDGYRFSIDSIILASQVTLKGNETILDIGTGCGVISLILAYLYPNAKIFGIDIQSQLVDLANLNIKLNSFENSIRIFNHDLTTIQPKEPFPIFDIVVSNPPYRKIQSGRINPNSQRAIARHEICANLSDIISSAKRMLRNDGRLFIIYLAERLVDLVSVMRIYGIEPKKVRMIYPKTGSDATNVVIEGIKGAGQGIKIVPPLIVYRDNGLYSNELDALFEM